MLIVRANPISRLSLVRNQWELECVSPETVFLTRHLRIPDVIEQADGLAGYSLMLI